MEGAESKGNPKMTSFFRMLSFIAHKTEMSFFSGCFLLLHTKQRCHFFQDVIFYCTQNRDVIFFRMFPFIARKTKMSSRKEITSWEFIFSFSHPNVNVSLAFPHF